MVISLSSPDQRIGIGTAHLLGNPGFPQLPQSCQVQTEELQIRRDIIILEFAE